GSSCVAQTLTCTNGVLSPAGVTNATCGVAAPGSCIFNGATLASGATTTGFTTSSVPYGSLCSSVATTVSCTNGTISPAGAAATCCAAAPASCMFNGATLASGATTSGFIASSVPYGSLCSSVATTVSCTNGTISPAGAVAACSPAAPANC